MSLSYTLLVPCEISLDPIALLHNYNPMKAHWIFLHSMRQEQALTGLRRAGVPMGAKAAAEPASASTAVAREIIVL